MKIVMSLTRRYFAFDESCPLDPKSVYPDLTDAELRLGLGYPFVVGVVSDDVADVRRGEKSSHNFDKFSALNGSFNYTRIRPELYSAAQQIYGMPETRTEISWNGHFYEFRLRTDAIIKLLMEMGFDSSKDVAFIDGFGKCSYLRDGVQETWQRVSGEKPPNNSIICKRGIGRQHKLGRAAHQNARKLVERWEHDDYDGDDPRYASHLAEFTRDDMMRLNLN